ncbi:hypothetical protein Tco_1024957 [Tanacetum coccineum]
MSAITDIRCVLTQKALDAFCDKFHILEEVHPDLPNQNDTMHERPAGKIGLYTRFFDYTNFRLPLSTFLVDVLRHFRINISQLSVIGAAKVSYFEIPCRVYGIIPTVGLFRCFYVNSKKSGWMSFSKRSDNAPVNDFACPASFSWNTAKHVTRHPDPVAADFNAQDYATLVSHPSPFWKFPEVFLNGYLCFHPYPGSHQNHAKSELEASVKRLFDEGGSGNQTEQWDSAVEGKMLTSSHLLRLRILLSRWGFLSSQKAEGGSWTPSGAVVGGKSRSAIKRLLAGAVLNAEVRVAAIPTLPFVAASVSSTLEREDGDHTDSVAEPNLRTIGSSQRFVISSDSSHHSGPTIAEAEVDSLIRSSAPIMMTVTTVTSTVDPALVAKEKPVKPFLFSVGSFSAGGADPNTGVFSDLTDSDFLVGGIRTVIDPDTNLLKVYVPQWSVTNGSRLDDGHVCHEMVDKFAPLKFCVSVRGMEHD